MRSFDIRDLFPFFFFSSSPSASSAFLRETGSFDVALLKYSLVKM